MESGSTVERVVRRWGARWFGLLVAVSAMLVFVTFLGSALQPYVPRSVSRLLFWLGLSGEDNIGAWWSGTLLLLGAVMAFDGYRRRDACTRERRAWLALSVILTLLSFDEVASLHEYLANTSFYLLLPPAAIGGGLTLYVLGQLYRANAPRDVTVGLIVAFALLATVPLQETIQQTSAWSNSILYGLRSALEEGVEVTAMLIMIRIASRNTAALFASSPSGGLDAPVALRRHVILAAAFALPVLVLATGPLQTSGAADWLAGTLYTLCALAAIRDWSFEPRRRAGAMLALLGFYLTASAASNAIRIEWDPHLLGTAVSLRGLSVAGLMLGAALLFPALGRASNPVVPGIAALIAICASLWPQEHALWCALPPLFALFIYARQTRIAEPPESSPLPLHLSVR